MLTRINKFTFRQITTEYNVYIVLIFQVILSIGFNPNKSYCKCNNIAADDIVATPLFHQANGNRILLTLSNPQGARYKKLDAVALKN